MTKKRSLEDILAQYTEDIVAERRPRIAEDIAALDENERSQLMALLPIVRRLKATHCEVPLPREEFVQHLEALVRDEIAKQSPAASQALPSATGGYRPIVAKRPALDAVLELGRAFFLALRGPSSGMCWRVVGATVAVILVGLQVLLYLQVRQLEQQNQALVARLEPQSPSASLVPLGLPQGKPSVTGRETREPVASSIDDLVAGLELRVRIEHRIAELEKELETKTGEDRQIAEALLSELRGLLRSSQKP